MANGTPNPALAVGYVDSGWFVFNSKCAINPDGGICEWVKNKDAGASVKGYLVDTTVDGVKLTAVNDLDAVGVWYSAGVAQDESGWIVVGGRGYVYFCSAATAGHYARVAVTADTGEAAGMAASEALPSTPFAADNHLREVGHVQETTGGAGLALCFIHFN